MKMKKTQDRARVNHDARARRHDCDAERMANVNLVNELFNAVAVLTVVRDRLEAEAGGSPAPTQGRVVDLSRPVEVVVEMIERVAFELDHRESTAKRPHLAVAANE